jgi:ribonuclease P protein component
MLARPYRFHGYNSLRRVYKDGQGVRGTDLSLKFLARPGGKPYRVAVVVSRKVSKSAVTRNRIRRRVYEAVRLSDCRPEHTDLVFTAFHERLAGLPAAELQQAVDRLLKKVA